jgi:hypothetical protein
VEQARSRGEPASLISAWREIARMLNFYEPKRHQVEVSAAADAEMGRLERLSDDKLVRLVATG